MREYRQLWIRGGGMSVDPTTGCWLWAEGVDIDRVRQMVARRLGVSPPSPGCNIARCVHPLHSGRVTPAGGSA